MAIKVMLTTALTACFCQVATFPLSSGYLDAMKWIPWQTHLFGQFLHANLFHLLANVCVLWQLRFSWRKLAVAYAVSVPATFATWSGEAIGFSSVLYALIGMQMAQARLSRTAWIWFIAANAATAFVPSVAFGTHVSAFVMGFLCLKIKRLSDEYRGACKRG